MAGKICPSCGATNPAGATKCVYCRAALPADAVVVKKVRKPVEFEPEEVKEELVEDENEFEDEDLDELDEDELDDEEFEDEE